MRLDQLLVQNGMFETRSKAQEAIKNNVVTVNGVIRKSSFDCVGTETIEIIGFTNPYVSRAALKLKKAIELFQVDFSGKTILDVGSSTGGFTEVSLEAGAKKVYAVDVGHSQLDKKLFENPKVVSMEKTNILDVEETSIDQIDWIVMDVSFVSITKLIEHLKNFTTNMIVLIKPQFESEGKHLHKGVIKNYTIRQQILSNTIRYIESIGLKVLKVEESPIKGKEGNIEFITLIGR